MVIQLCIYLCGDWEVKVPQGISGSILVRNTIPMATPVFSESHDSLLLSVTLSYETGSQKSKMVAEITSESANIHDSEKSPTETNGNTTRCPGMT
jgi:hypothetical protein